jgi:tetratricopeptide (TPR) repeat protein
LLFTDLVGSTELLSRLGEYSFDELRAGHFAALREAVAKASGREIKTLGDGLLAVFGSASDAVAAAIAAQQSVDRHGRDTGLDLAMRVGLALGDVVFEGEDVFGAPVVEAARIVSIAAPDQILATAVVRAVAGARSGATFTDLGTVTLKGIPEPVAVCEVGWQPLPSPVVPLPAALVHAGQIFVGRDRELDRCLTMWKEVVAGGRRTALVAGEPGIGKTRLAAELAREVHGDGAVVLAGRCDEDLGVPYQPFVEALRHYVSHASDVRVGRFGGELVRLVPELAERVAGLPDRLRSDPETERYRLFDAVAAWIGDVSRSAPVMLVLDDLHWATKPTVLLLRHMLRSHEDLRVLVVVTYRDTDLRHSPLAEFLADSRREEGTERFHLGGLDRAAVADFIDLAGGRSSPEDHDEAFSEAMWAETEGHPFFVSELLRHLSESGVVARLGGRLVLARSIDELGVPPGVRDVVDRRLSRLSAAVRDLLTTAAVAGMEFEPALVQIVAGVGEDVLCAALDEAMQARLVVEVPGTHRSRFVHSLVRVTLYEELSSLQRVALHRRTAAALEAAHGSTGDQLPALAHQSAQAAVSGPDRERAANYAIEAGDQALAQHANDEAVAYYQQALDLLEAPGGSTADEVRVEVRISLGEAQRRAGLPEHRETLLTAARLARRGGDAGQLARAALANTRGMIFSRGGLVDDDRVEMLEAAIEATGPADGNLRARLLSVLGLELVFAADAADRRFELSDEAVAVARTLPDRSTLAQVLTARYYTTYTPATLADRLTTTAELFDIAHALGDPVTLCRAAWLRFRCLLEVGDIDEAATCFALGESLAAELGQPTLRWLAAWNAAGWTVRSGRLDDARSAVEAAYELGRRTGQPDASVFYAIQSYYVCEEQERLGELVPILERAAKEFRDLPLFELLLADAYCQTGRDADARTIYDPLAATNFTSLRVDLTWTVAVVACIAIADHFHDIRAALRLYDLVSPYADQVVVTQSIICGATTHHLGILAGMLGRSEDAERYFADALQRHERLGTPTWRARTGYRWGRLLAAERSQRDSRRCRSLLTDAAEIARAYRLEGLESKALATLREIGR